MPTPSIRLDITGELELQEQLALLKLPPAKRRRFNGQLGRTVIKNSRKRVRTQRDLQGRGFAPRQGKSRKKMLARMLRGKNIKVYASQDSAKVTWPNHLTGQIARMHQEGIAEIMTSAKMAKIHGQPDYEGEATKKQAIALREEGYTIKGKGKRRKKPSAKWIIENMTLGQAGLILRMMRNKKKQSQWVIPVPERAFLGMSHEEITQASREILHNMTTKS